MMFVPALMCLHRCLIRETVYPLAHLVKISLKVLPFPPPHRSLHVALASGRWRTTVVDCQLETRTSSCSERKPDVRSQPAGSAAALTNRRFGCCLCLSRSAGAWRPHGLREKR